MNVLVTGGTGFVGREILRELQAAGHYSRLLVRNAKAPAVQELATKYISEVSEADILDATSLAKAMAGTDAVIHLIGIISEHGDQTFENVHVRATQNLVQAALVTGTRRFIHMSALGTRPNAKSHYHQSKWAAEQAVNGSALDWTIFRPSIIYGPGDKSLNFFLQMSEWSPIIPLVGRPRAVFQPIGVEAVAGFLVKALKEHRSYGQTFDLCGPDRFPLAEMVRMVLKAAGRKSWVTHIPDDLAEPLAWLLEQIYPGFRGQPSPLTRDQLIMLKEDNVGEMTWPVNLFQIQPRGFAEGIQQYIKPVAPRPPKPQSRKP